MPKSVIVKIQDCSQCPHQEVKRHYTADSFEMVFDWVCLKNHGAIVAIVEWNDKKPKIPEWCPLPTKE